MSIKAGARLGHPVEVWCLDMGEAVEPGITSTQIIRHTEDDIGAVWLLASETDRGKIPKGQAEDSETDKFACWRILHE
ncbi:hypothetical protein N9B94_00025 [Verrucomicrobia bacterium]|nr:hypothetical protein [Verrucomicrobiota bacterium]